MKKILSTALAMLLLLAMTLTLVSCGSTYGSIKSNFEKHGYTVSAEESGEIETDNGKITYTVHVFSKKTDGDNFLENLGSALTSVTVWEFGSDADLKKAVGESETLKGAISDAQDSDYVNGNCVLVPLNLNAEAVDIFKGRK